MIVSVRVPIKLVSVANMREHWAAKHRRSRLHRQTTRLTLQAAGKPPAFGRALISFIRVGGRRMDSDNLVHSCKAARDGVADWLGVDDGAARLLWHYGQVAGKRGQHELRIDVEFEP